MIGETWKPFVANGAARSLTRGAAAAQMVAFASAASAGAFGFRRFFLASPQLQLLQPPPAPSRAGPVAPSAHPRPPPTIRPTARDRMPLPTSLTQRPPLAACRDAQPDALALVAARRRRSTGIFPWPYGPFLAALRCKIGRASCRGRG